MVEILSLVTLNKLSNGKSVSIKFYIQFTYKNAAWYNKCSKNETNDFIFK